MRCAGPRASDCTRAPAGFQPGVPAQIGHVPFNPLTSQHFTFHAGTAAQFEINNHVPPPSDLFCFFFFSANPLAAPSLLCAQVYRLGESRLLSFGEISVHNFKRPIFNSNVAECDSKFWKFERSWSCKPLSASQVYYRG